MSHVVRRWMFGLAMLFTLAAFCQPADAQVIVRVGPHRHYRHHRHHHHHGYRR
jgi:hypothetical protein